MVVECQAVFYNADQEDTLGIKSEPILLPIAFDMRDVVVVNKYEEDQARLYFRNGDIFLTDMAYNYAVHLFIFVRGGDENENWLAEARDAWNKNT